MVSRTERRHAFRSILIGSFSFQKTLSIVRNAALAFFRHDDLTLAAALAFYVTLAFAPAVVLSLWAAASISSNAQQSLLNELDLLAGQDVKAVAQMVIEHAEQAPTAGSIAGIVGIVFLVISASAVFTQLQSTLNTIWNIKSHSSSVVFDWLKHRLLSIGMLAAAIFILVVTLVVSAVLSFGLEHLSLVWKFLNQIIGIIVFTIIFSCLFRYLPSERMPLHRAISGGFLTAILFAVGKFAIGQYLAHSNAGGAYGPAGGLVVLLIWVYYSSAIFYFGAEIVGQEFERTKSSQ